MGIAFFFLSVVVDQFNVKGIGLFEAKNDAPIGPHCDCPKPFPFSLERVQAIAGKVESLWRDCGIAGP